MLLAELTGGALDPEPEDHLPPGSDRCGDHRIDLGPGKLPVLVAAGEVRQQLRSIIRDGLLELVPVVAG